MDIVYGTLHELSEDAKPEFTLATLVLKPHKNF